MLDHKPSYLTSKTSPLRKLYWIITRSKNLNLIFQCSFKLCFPLFPYLLLVVIQVFHYCVGPRCGGGGRHADGEAGHGVPRRGQTDQRCLPRLPTCYIPGNSFMEEKNNSTRTLNLLGPRSVALLNCHIVAISFNRIVHTIIVFCCLEYWLALPKGRYVHTVGECTNYKCLEHCLCNVVRTLCLTLWGHCV